MVNSSEDEEEMIINTKSVKSYVPPPNKYKPP